MSVPKLGLEVVDLQEEKHKIRTLNANVSSERRFLKLTSIVSTGRLGRGVARVYTKIVSFVAKMK